MPITKRDICTVCDKEQKLFSVSLSFLQSSVTVPNDPTWCSPNAHKRVVVFSSLADFISLSTFIANTLASEHVRFFPVCLSLLAVSVLYLWSVSCQLLSPQRGSFCYLHVCQHALSQLDRLSSFIFLLGTLSRSSSCLYISNILRRTLECVMLAATISTVSVLMKLCVLLMYNSAALWRLVFFVYVTFLCSLTCFFWENWHHGFADFHLSLEPYSLLAHNMSSALSSVSPDCRSSLSLTRLVATPNTILSLKVVSFCSSYSPLYISSLNSFSHCSIVSQSR